MFDILFILFLLHIVAELIWRPRLDFNKEDKSLLLWVDGMDERGAKRRNFIKIF